MLRSETPCKAWQACSLPRSKRGMLIQLRVSRPNFALHGYGGQMLASAAPRTYGANCKIWVKHGIERILREQVDQSITVTQV